jgi:hypothetical protein
MMSSWSSVTTIFFLVDSDKIFSFFIWSYLIFYKTLSFYLPVKVILLISMLAIISMESPLITDLLAIDLLLGFLDTFLLFLGDIASFDFDTVGFDTNVEFLEAFMESLLSMMPPIYWASLESIEELTPLPPMQESFMILDMPSNCSITSDLFYSL